jgi:uncharacterized protein YecT (DUF1311 family)
MMSLGLATLPMDSLPDACGDARTIGALAWSMLTGRSYDAATTDDKTLADLRPGLSSEVIAETEALLACENGSEAGDIAAFISMLRTAKETPLVAQQPWAAPVERAAAVPVGSPAPAEQAVIVRRRTRSPIAAALVVAALVIVAAMAFLKWRGADRSHVASGDVDTTAVASGDRTSPMEATPPPLPAGSARPPAPTIDSSMIVTTPTPMSVTPYPTPLPTSAQPTTAIAPSPSTVQPMPTVASSTPLPARPAPVVTPDTTVTKPVRDTVPSNPTDPCNSDNAGDQRACFNAALAKNDVELNRVYGDVIASMRRRANVGDSDPDPESVRELRAAQRRWISERDAECRRRGEGSEGARWAQSRAACFAELSAERTRQLAQMRDNLP